MTRLRTIIVDNYQTGIDQLTQTISKTYPQLNILDEYPIAPESLQKISHVYPDLVFFDVGRPHMHGLDLLANWEKIPDCQFVLTDIEAFPMKFNYTLSITDCLPKPICRQKLSSTIKRVIDQHELKFIKKELLNLKQYLKNSLQSKIAIPTLKGIHMVDHSHIVYAEAADNYAILHMVDGNQMLSSQNLVKLEKQLFFLPFFRVHRCFLVNMNHIKSYIRGDGGHLILSNNKSLNVSRKKREALIDSLQRNCLG